MGFGEGLALSATVAVQVTSGRCASTKNLDHTFVEVLFGNGGAER